MPLSINSPHKETEDECGEQVDNSSIISSNNPFRFVPACLREKD
jgi:hypothetical protein